jgi:hypothetical protein
MVHHASHRCVQADLTALQHALALPAKAGTAQLARQYRVQMDLTAPVLAPVRMALSGMVPLARNPLQRRRLGMSILRNYALTFMQTMQV